MPEGNSSFRAIAAKRAVNSRGVLPILAYAGRLRPKGVPFSGFRYIKG